MDFDVKPQSKKRRDGQLMSVDFHFIPAPDADVRLSRAIAILLQAIETDEVNEQEGSGSEKESRS